VGAQGRTSRYVVPLAVFAATRLLSALALVLVTPHGYSYLHAVTYWDGGWYRQVAEHGYPSVLPVHHGVVGQSGWAFYPLYPGLVRLLMTTGLSYDLAAPAVSLVCGAAAMCLLHAMLRPTVGGFGAGMAVLALCVYPAAPAFLAAYTESLALLLVLGALWCLRARRYAGVLLLAVALSLTRPVVLPLCVPVALHAWARWRTRREEPFPRREAAVVAAVAVLTAASFALWPAVAALVTGRPDAYVVTAQAWLPAGAHGWPSWPTSLVTGQQVRTSTLGLVALLLLAAVPLRRATRTWGPELRAWAVAYPLYLLVATRPTTSIVRYAMLAAVPWWPWPEVGWSVTSRRARAALVAVVTGVGFVLQVLWLRYCFVLGPAWYSFP
jgi:hypothetical protein